MKTLACAVLALAATITGCGNEEKEPGALNDADLSRLHIDQVDESSVRVYGADVVDPGTSIHVENMTQGPELDVVGDDDGGMNATIRGGLDHVYLLQSRGARAIGVVRRAVLREGGSEDVSIVRGYGIGFASATGCELQGWSGIIHEAAGDPRTTCTVGAASDAEGESMDGPVSPFVLRGSTVITITSTISGVGAEPPRFEIDFIDDNGAAFTVPVLAQGTPGQLSSTVLDVGQISPELPGRIVEHLALRAPAGSSLVIADITFVDLGPPDEI